MKAGTAFILLFVLALGLCLSAGAEQAALEYRAELDADGSGSHAVITGGGGEDLLIPSEIDGLPVWRIGREAFAGRAGLKTVTVEKGVRSIEPRAFADCPDLEEVSLPESLAFIEEEAFRNCGSLRSAKLPGIRSAGQVLRDAFSSVGLAELILGDGSDLAAAENNGDTPRFSTLRDGWSYRRRADGTLVLTGAPAGEDVAVPAELDGKPVAALDEGLFMNRTDLVRVTLPDGLRVIGRKAFADCSSLREINLPDSLLRAEPLAFFRTALPLLRLPAGAEAESSLVWYASEDRTDYSGPWTWNLLADGTAMISGYTARGNTVHFPDSVEGHPVTAVMQCGERYLQGAGEISKVVMPKGLRVIGDRAFHRFGTREMTIPPRLEEIGEGAFYNCPRLDHLRLPATLRRLGRGAFNYCRRLGNIALPDGLEEIPARAFEGCSRLSAVRLPATLRVIGEKAFAQCNLKNITLPNRLEIVRRGAFLQHSIQVLVLPAGLKRVEAEAFYSYNPACPKKVRFLSTDTVLETGVFGYAQRDPNGSLADPLNRADCYHEPTGMGKAPIQLECIAGSTADLMYIYNVTKIHRK